MIGGKSRTHLVSHQLRPAHSPARSWKLDICTELQSDSSAVEDFGPRELPPESCEESRSTII